MIRKEKLHVKIISVERSKDVNTSVKVTSKSIPNSNNTQSFMSCGGQIEIVLFLKNMSDRIEELQALVGKDFDVLHFKCSVYDLTNNEQELVFTEDYKEGLSALTWNTANLTTSDEEAFSVISSEFQKRLNDGTYWFEDKADKKSTRPQPNSTPKKDSTIFLKRELLNMVITDISLSDSNETSIVVHGISSPKQIKDTEDLQNFLSTGGNRKINLYLRNAKHMLDTLQRFVGESINVLHFEISCKEICGKDYIYSDDFEYGFSTLTYNTANLKISNEEALKIIKEIVRTKFLEGEYWFDTENLLHPNIEYPDCVDESDYIEYNDNLAWPEDI